MENGKLLIFGELGLVKKEVYRKDVFY